MGRKPKNATQILVVPPGDDEEEKQPASEQQAREEIERAVAEMPSQAQARIFRAHPATGNREGLVDTIPADLFSQEYIRETYGGGRYRVQFFGRRSDGRQGYLKQVTFEIDPTIPPKVPGVPPPSSGQQTTVQQVAAPVQSPTLDSAVIGMLTTMMTQIASQAQAAASAQAALVQMQMQMMQDHSAALQAQLQKLSEPKDTLGEMEKIVGMIKDLSGPQRSLKEELETLGLLKEFVGGEGGAGNTTWLDVIKEVAPSLLDAAKKRDAAAAVMPKPVPSEIPLTGPITGPVASPSPSPQQQELQQVDPKLRVLAPLVPRLVRWAAQGKDPALCAEWLLSDIPPGYIVLLRANLSAPTIVQEVVAAFPAAQPFQPWLEELRVAILESSEPEGEPEQDDDDEGG